MFHFENAYNTPKLLEAVLALVLVLNYIVTIHLSARQQKHLRPDAIHSCPTRPETCAASFKGKPQHQGP